MKIFSLLSFIQLLIHLFDKYLKYGCHYISNSIPNYGRKKNRQKWILVAFLWHGDSCSEGHGSSHDPMVVTEPWHDVVIDTMAIWILTINFSCLNFFSHLLTDIPTPWSVLQIAANEETCPIDELYKYCEIARDITMKDEWKVGRIIARPFIGIPGNFKRTSNRFNRVITF